MRVAPRTRRRARRAGSPCRARLRTCSSTVAISSVSRWSSPDDGSSRNSRSGSHTRARASSTTRPVPSVSECGGTIGVVGRGRPARGSRRSARAPSVEGRERPVRSRHRLAPPRWARSATSRWSRTVRLPNSSMRWNVRDETESGPLVRRQPGEVVALQQDLPGVRAQHAGQAVEERRLAGPVGSDERDQLAGEQVHRHVGQRRDALEPLADAVGDEHRLLGLPVPPAAMVIGSPPPMRPALHSSAGPLLRSAGCSLRPLNRSTMPRMRRMLIEVCASMMPSGCRA